MPTPLCILLVDDSRFFLNLERQFLRNTPAAVVEAQTVEQALEAARTHRPSLIFMDIDMPGTDGLTACRTFKQDPGLRSIPLVLIGDKAHPELGDQALRAGADGFLPKPLDRRAFLDTGHRYLYSIERREPRRVLRISVLYSWNGQEEMGQCNDISSGGMFLAAPPFADKGTVLTLKFNLPDSTATTLCIQGRIAWVNLPDREIKPNYPPGYGIEFIGLSEADGIALRRCFG